MQLFKTFFFFLSLKSFFNLCTTHVFYIGKIIAWTTYVVLVGMHADGRTSGHFHITTLQSADPVTAGGAIAVHLSLRQSIIFLNFLASSWLYSAFKPITLDHFWILHVPPCPWCHPKMSKFLVTKKIFTEKLNPDFNFEENSIHLQVTLQINTIKKTSVQKFPLCA